MELPKFNGDVAKFAQKQRQEISHVATFIGLKKAPNAINETKC